MRVALIGCGKQKRPGVWKARELYTSARFKMALEYALENYDSVFVLSAKYGLLRLEDRVRSYEQSARDMTPQRRKEWCKSVIDDIRRVVPAGARVDFFCGIDYREPVMQELPEYTVHAPLKGLSMGKQLRWYKKRQPPH